MKMVSNMLASIEGIEIYYIVGLLLFFTLFVVILIRTIRWPNKEMLEIKESILTDNNSEEQYISQS